jgi:hypothetical protein
MDDPNDDSVGISGTCYIPTGTDLIELTDTNTRMFDKASVRFKLDGTPETVISRLILSSYNSDQKCECDFEIYQGLAGFFVQNLEFGGDVGGGTCTVPATCPTNWSLGVDFEVADDEPNILGITRLKVQSISVYDT